MWLLSNAVFLSKCFPVWHLPVVDWKLSQSLWDFSALIGQQCGMAVHICVLLTSALRGSEQPQLPFVRRLCGIQSPNCRQMLWKSFCLCCMIWVVARCGVLLAYKIYITYVMKCARFKETLCFLNRAMWYPYVIRMNKKHIFTLMF